MQQDVELYELAMRDIQIASKEHPEILERQHEHAEVTIRVKEQNSSLILKTRLPDTVEKQSLCNG